MVCSSWSRSSKGTSTGTATPNRTKNVRRHVTFFCAMTLLLLFLFLVISGVSGGATDPPNKRRKSSNEGSSSSNNNSKDRTPTQVISLAESINRSQKSLQDPERARASREQWELALKEIKELALDATTTTSAKGNAVKNKQQGPFTEWKLLLDQPSKVELNIDLDNAAQEVEDEEEPTITKPSDVELLNQQPKLSRFEGFASWERMLQDWADDVQEYIDKVEAENADYPMATYTQPKPKKEGRKIEEPPIDAKVTKETAETDSTAERSSDVATPTTKKKRSKISLPIPAPVKDGEPVLPHTDIADKSKRIWIVTTAALPWMTGTAVNPLLRAAYMTDGRAEAGGSVTIMLPWLERKQDRDSVYGENRGFDTPEEQEAFIRTWLVEKAKLPEASEKLKIEWYTSWQNKAENSLYSMGDITALIPAEEVDIMILEEPEHLNWYRAPGEHWVDKFKHVVGIVHTNYFAYATDQPAAFIRAPGMRLLCSWMCRAHCHRLIKLSGTLGRFAPEKELVENVHGVRASFLDTGKEVRKRLEAPDGARSDPVFGAEADPAIYFIGKMLWSKGLLSLMELLKYAEESAGIKVHIDMYGGGPDKDAAEARAQSLDVDMDFLGPIDHGELAFDHKIFINPSTSEVLTTTTAEALAMGKFVVLPSHPSNDFFAQFSNCLTYTNKEEFVGNLYYALTHSPEPLSDEESFTLSWEAATKRLEAAGSIPAKEAELMAEALKADEAGIEIYLPPFFEEDREKFANGLKRSRNRYREFRSRLSQEIMQSNVLPTRLKERLANELGKRLDLDFEKILDSPKLQLQLSPAELDKRLLELYEGVAGGPGGDLLRVIVGGNDVAFQTLYIKRNAARKRGKDASRSVAFGPFDGDDRDDNARTASQWVQRTLKRNLPRKNIPISSPDPSDSSTQQAEKDKTKMNMCLPASFRPGGRFASVPSTGRNHFCPPIRSSTSKFTLLI